MEKLKHLTAILHSNRVNLYYLEHSRVSQKDGRVVYLKEDIDRTLFYNIPISNTTVILLGTGTSITSAAMRMLSDARVLVAFCGSSGTPLIMSSESAFEVLTPSLEYRPTEYLQEWCSFWFNEEKRFYVAKEMQKKKNR